MSNARLSNKTNRDKVLSEFNFRCALCGKDRPQVHHIDEDPSNNDPANLIPLCPNCHLSDIHNPTQALAPEKLALFRKYKDPFILKPQFQPLFKRLEFLQRLDHTDLHALKSETKELLEFVAGMEMGAFYAKEIKKITNKPYMRAFEDLTEAGKAKLLAGKEGELLFYKENLTKDKERIYDLITELLRYQKW